MAISWKFYFVGDICLSYCQPTRWQAMALNLDLSKAYDQVEWDFLEAMMLRMAFPTSFVSLVMTCVKTSSFSTLVNGCPSEIFSPSCGICQGDPLS